LSVDIYLPFSIKPLSAFIAVCLWLDYITTLCAAYMIFNELQFNTMVLMISIEFDNLADDFGEFDYKKGDKKEFKILVERHNELLAIKDELDSIYRVPVFVTFVLSTFLICFSMLQLFNLGIGFKTTTEITNWIKFFIFFNTNILEIFLLCFFCEKTRTSGENLRMKLVSGNYYQAKDLKLIKNLQLVLMKAQRPVELRAFGFFGFNMGIFTDVS
jgi:hypothetical protein